MTERKPCPGEKWEQMPTEELDRVLQAELRKEHPDENVVLPILRTLELRETGKPEESSPDLHATTEQFSKHDTYTGRNDHRRAWITGIAALAAVVCIVAMALPKTVGADSILDVLYRWTSGIFEFFTPEQDATDPPVEYVFETDNPGLQQLYDKMTELGVSKEVVPTWLPEGFVLIELNELLLPSGNRVHGDFQDGSAVILLTYRITTDISPQVEKEDLCIEVFDIGGVAHFIVENESNFSVTWMVDGVECLLNANVAREELYTIIKSIYRSELPQ